MVNRKDIYIQGFSLIAQVKEIKNFFMFADPLSLTPLIATPC